MSNKEEINIRYYNIRKLVIIEFLDSDNSFFLGKNDCTQTSTIIETTYNLKGLTTSGCCPVSKREARALWNKLINDNFEQMPQLDDMLNGTDSPDKQVDEALFCFKIRDNKTGKYSKGGSYDGNELWNSQGKTWNQINHIKSHLSHLIYENEYINGKKIRNKKSNAYDDANLIILKEIRSIGLGDIEKVKDEVKKFKRRR